MRRSTALVTALMLFGTHPAGAQMPPAQPHPAQPGPPSGCAPAAGSGATVGSAQSGSSLSDKLARSNGVICPPTDLDPAMRVPPPQGGALKVIPPPGTPGGDQHAIPK
jgi:hypothetical protein